MFKKIVLGLVTALLIMSMATIGIQKSPVRAQDATESPDDEDVAPLFLEISGTVASITQSGNGAMHVVLEDGTVLVVNPATEGDLNLVVGQQYTFTVNLDEDGEAGTAAKSVTPGVPDATPVATDVATPAPTDAATPVATDVATPAPTDAATPVATEGATCGGNNAHPVGTRLAEAFGVDYNEIMSLHCGGMGFGEIARAYLLAEKTGRPVDEFLALRAAGEGWGKIMKDAGVRPNELAPGQVIKGKKHSSEDGTTTSDSSSKGNKGKGSGKDKGGKGKGNSNGNSGK